ncbi:hypothetical protein HUN42_00090 [Streptomyces phage Dagobah]|nr:hypothetical protein HUN42_00090 [Streptomyces phage Dagobah]
MSELVWRTVLRNLGLTLSFAVGAGICRVVLAWSGRDVTLIMR